MKKFAKIINEKTKQCEVGIGTDNNYYISIGLSELDVEQADTGLWYLTGYVPTPTKEEQAEKRKQAYQQEVDFINLYIQRLKLEAEPDQEKIDELIKELNEKVAAIKERYPYPEEEV